GRLRRRVLVVEDEPLVLDYIATVLKRIGYEAVSATNGKQACDLFYRYAHELALILVEILVPRMSGPEFIASLPTLDPRIPVVFVTCMGTDEVNEKLDVQFPILFKPFTPSELKTAMQRLALPVY